MFHIIYILRTYLGLSQCKLAKLAGVTQPDLSELETLPPYGRIDKYCRVADVLGVSVDTLVKNDPRTVPMEFFEKHPALEFSPMPKRREKRLGRYGEEFILRRERERLEKIAPVLPKLVLPFCKMKISSPGFDILSFDEEGRPLCLEVKTSEHSVGNFNMTRKEIESAQKIVEAGVPYHICCISGWGSENQSVQDIPFTALQNAYEIAPTHYKCTPIPAPTKINGLAYYRRIREMTQEDVAEMLDVQQCNLCLYETGARQVPVQVYLKASELYHVPIDELLLSYESPTRNRVDLNYIS